MTTQLVQEQYNQWSEDYDSDENLTRDLDETITKAILGTYSFNSMLEIGCGTGKNTNFFATISNHVLSMDFSEGMLEKAKRNIDNPHVSFTQTDLTEDWPTKSDGYELASCNLVLEHIEDLNHIFEEAYRSLKIDGLFFISELHPFRQYTGTQANFNKDGVIERIPAYIHNVSEYLKLGKSVGFELLKMDEWKHEYDNKIYPRILTLLLKKKA